MSKQKREKFPATATPEKTPQDKTFVQVEGKLTEAQLEAIAGGNYNDECTNVANCGVNHNETMFVFSQLNLEGETHV